MAPQGETWGSITMTQPGLQFRSTLIQATAPSPFHGLGQRVSEESCTEKKLQLYWKQTNKPGFEIQETGDTGYLGLRKAGRFC